MLAARGVARGDRVAVLSENRAEVLELLLAAARLGAIVACQSWRLAAPELRHCIELVEPKLAIVSPRHARFRRGLDRAPIVLGDDYEAALAAAPRESARATSIPRTPLVILYTSGTTGLPKGAVISHRAQIVRNLVTRAEFGDRARRHVRRVVAALSHGRGRQLARHADGGRHGDRRRRLRRRRGSCEIVATRSRSAGCC